MKVQVESEQKSLALPGAPVWQQGGVSALDLKAEQGFSGWRERRAFRVNCQPQAGRWRTQRPESMYWCQLFFFFSLFLSPWKETSGSVWFTWMNHLLPGWAWELEISTGGGSFSVVLQNVTHQAPPKMLTIQSLHSFTVHSPNGLEPLLCVS